MLRRDVIAAGTGILAAPILGAMSSGRAFGQSATSPPIEGKGGLRNPLNEYPKPPFKRQNQEPPGLALKMEPRPDHGENSYRGSGKLLGRKALITGGDSG